ncbi:MAG TPA: hypothetical protein VJA16_19790 [Thermoanaerobaculia bacterium]
MRVLPERQGCLHFGAAWMAAAMTLPGMAVAIWAIVTGIRLTMLLRDPYDLAFQRCVLETPQAVAGMIRQLHDGAFHGAAMIAALGRMLMPIAVLELGALSVVLLTTPVRATGRARRTVGGWAAWLRSAHPCLGRRTDPRQQSATCGDAATLRSRWTEGRRAWLAAGLAALSLLFAWSAARQATLRQSTLATHPASEPRGQHDPEPSRILTGIEQGYDDFAWTPEAALALGFLELACFTGSAQQLAPLLRRQRPRNQPTSAPAGPHAQ